MQDYSAASAWSWTPAEGDEGGHAVQVRVRSHGSGAPFEAWKATGTFVISR